jgi:hypothetical protein
VDGLIVVHACSAIAAINAVMARLLRAVMVSRTTRRWSWFANRALQFRGAGALRPHLGVGCAR